MTLFVQDEIKTSMLQPNSEAASTNEEGEDVPKEDENCVNVALGQHIVSNPDSTNSMDASENSASCASEVEPKNYKSSSILNKSPGVAMPTGSSYDHDRSSNLPIELHISEPSMSSIESCDESIEPASSTPIIKTPPASNSTALENEKVNNEKNNTQPVNQSSSSLRSAEAADASASCEEISDVDASESRPLLPPVSSNGIVQQPINVSNQNMDFSIPIKADSSIDKCYENDNRKPSSSMKLLQHDFNGNDSKDSSKSSNNVSNLGLQGNESSKSGSRTHSSYENINSGNTAVKEPTSLSDPLLNPSQYQQCATESQSAGPLPIDPTDPLLDSADVNFESKDSTAGRNSESGAYDQNLVDLSLTPHLHALLLASMTQRRQSHSCCPHLFERAAHSWWNPRFVASFFLSEKP